MDLNAWWGYIHENDTLHVKRYYGLQDIIEAKESPFCKRIHGPFPAKNSEQAMEFLKEHDLIWILRYETGLDNTSAWKLMIRAKFNLKLALELFNESKNL